MKSKLRVFSLSGIVVAIVGLWLIPKLNKADDLGYTKVNNGLQSKPRVTVTAVDTSTQNLNSNKAIIASEAPKNKLDNGNKNNSAASIIESKKEEAVAEDKNYSSVPLDTTIPSATEGKRKLTNNISKTKNATDELKYKKYKNKRSASMKDVKAKWFSRSRPEWDYDLPDSNTSVQ